MLNDKERRFLRKCIDCERPSMDIIDNDMVTLSCPTRDFTNCWKKGDY